MSENDHLELQEINPEPTTRAELKRLILKYLQTRSREKNVSGSSLRRGFRLGRVVK